jgi:hypothetical protein
MRSDNLIDKLIEAVSSDGSSELGPSLARRVFAPERTGR